MKGCKQCPAFAKCTVQYRGSGCAALRSTYGVETDPEIITNADRIRAMSDEELARFLTWNVPDCINFCNDARCGCKWNCKHGEGLHFITNWLRQPAKEAQHG